MLIPRNCGVLVVRQKCWRLLKLGGKSEGEVEEYLYPGVQIDRPANSLNHITHLPGKSRFLYAIVSAAGFWQAR